MVKPYEAERPAVPPPERTLTAGSPTYSAGDYWEAVASELRERAEGRSIAGDASPFYVLKRQQLTGALLAPVLRDGSSALEVGCGPGGNLKTLGARGMDAAGVDISATMLELARDRGISRLARASGASIPIRSRSVEMSILVTVLQHNPDSEASSILQEAARVARREVHLFEDTSAIPFHDRRSHWMRSPRWYVNELAGYGFELVHRERLRLMPSELCAVLVRVVTSRQRGEGAPVTERRLAAERAFMRVSRRADRLCPPLFGLTRLSFERMVSR